MTRSARQSIERQTKDGLLRRFAPLRKRFAFVAGMTEEDNVARARGCAIAHRGRSRHGARDRRTQKFRRARAGHLCAASARLVRQERFDGSPFIIGEFVAPRLSLAVGARPRRFHWRVVADAILRRLCQFIARGGKLAVLEGQWQHARTVIIGFPSREAAEGWYKSADYQKNNLSQAQEHER